MTKSNGYKSRFIGKRLSVRLPQPSPALKADFALVEGRKKFGLLHYPHFSVQLSKRRKMPVFTVVNIDGKLFRKINRDALFPNGTDRWQVDERASAFQWGEELYNADGSNYDKGHLVKREDPQWGKTDEEAIEASRATFFYSNCAPQVDDLNRREWRGLEDYILKKESTTNKLRIITMTGPVLGSDDPVFVQPVNGQEVQLPTLFWKVVYYTNDGKSLRRVGFLMGQKELLLQRSIAQPITGERELFPKPFFEDYEDAATFQVNISLIESLTGLTFSPAKDRFRDTRPTKIVLKEVEIPNGRGFSSSREAIQNGKELDFELKGLSL